MARLQAVLDADTRGFDRKMNQSQTTTQKFGNVAKAALVGGVAAGLYAVGKAAQIGWGEYNEGAKVAAQTNAVIKSTGGVANVTSQHVEDLGRQLMLLSGVDDELIKSGENVLLTFKAVRNEAGKGNDIFDQTTKLALDLSTALGTDLQSANIQLGKALQGSSTGLTALKRSGVTFSDTQVALIGHLFDTNQTLKAQKMILAEVRTEFGGSAKAVGDTFGGQLLIARERLNNFLGDLTEKAIPGLQRLAKWLNPRITNAIDTVGKFIKELQDDWRQLNAILQRHQETVSAVVKVLGFLASALKLAARWNIFLYGTIIKVELAVLRLALAIGDKLIAAFHKVAGPARAAFAAVSAAVRFALGPIFALISALERVVSLYNSVKGAITSTGSGQPTGRGGSGHRAMGGPVFAGRSYTVGERGPETFVPRVSGTIIPAGGGAVYNFHGPVLDGDALLRYIRGQADKFERRNGRSAF